MDRQLLIKVVSELQRYGKSDNELDRKMCFILLDSVCLDGSPNCIFKELNLLGEVLTELNASYLIDYFAVYDFRLAQVLDVLVPKQAKMVLKHWCNECSKDVNLAVTGMSNDCIFALCPACGSEVDILIRGIA